MPVRPDWDPRGIKLFPFENPGDFVEYSNIGVFKGTDWFYCVLRGASSSRTRSLPGQPRDR